jgi:hypothetical protein
MQPEFRNGGVDFLEVLQTSEWPDSDPQVLDLILSS